MPLSLRPTIATRLAAALAFMLLLLLSMGGLGGWQLQRVHEVSSGLVARSTGGLSRAGALAHNIGAYRTLQGYYRYPMSARDAAATSALLISLRVRIEQGLELARRSAPTQAETVVFGRLAAAWNAYAAAIDAFDRDGPRPGDPRLPADIGAIEDSYNQVGVAIGAAIELKMVEAEQADTRINAIVVDSLWVLGGAMLACLAVMVALLWFVRRRVCTPLTTITHGLSALAGGNLAIQLPGLERQDEIGAMTRAFDVFRLNAIALLAAHEATAAAERQAYRQARHDALTGLANRVLFREHLERVLPTVRRGGHVAVLSLDLDGFKAVNDTWGHPAGDRLLRLVADRLIESTRETDLVARLGGDEFAIIQSDAEQPAAAAALAERLVATLAEPFELDGAVVEIGTSIGVMMASIEIENADDLLRNADIALYRAKAAGRGTSCLFETGMDAENQRRRLAVREVA